PLKPQGLGSSLFPCPLNKKTIPYDTNNHRSREQCGGVVINVQVKWDEGPVMNEGHRPPKPGRSSWKTKTQSCPPGAHRDLLKSVKVFHHKKAAIAVMPCKWGKGIIQVNVPWRDDQATQAAGQFRDNPIEDKQNDWLGYKSNSCLLTFIATQVPTASRPGSAAAIHGQGQ
ncbi:hypothetical protein A6R68_12478, partial [Neotoma lepida]